MEKIADLAKQILEKLVDFFDILDLSFFVSGAMVLVGCLLLLKTVDGPQPNWDSSMQFAAVVLACYLLGLMSFAAGRSIRRWFGRFMFLGSDSVADWLYPAVLHHDLLSRDPLTAYAAHADLLKRRDPSLANSIYTRLWVELRQRDALKASYALLRRYWVLSATYDGMAVSLLYWCVVAVIVTINGYFDGVSEHLGEWGVSGVLILLFLYLSRSCFAEAKRLQRYQVVEIVATLAYLQERGVDDDRRARAVAEKEKTEDEAGKKKERPTEPPDVLEGKPLKGEGGMG